MSGKKPHNNTNIKGERNKNFSLRHKQSEQIYSDKLGSNSTRDFKDNINKSQQVGGRGIKQFGQPAKSTHEVQKSGSVVMRRDPLSKVIQADEKNLRRVDLKKKEEKSFSKHQEEYIPHTTKRNLVKNVSKEHKLKEAIKLTGEKGTIKQTVFSSKIGSTFESIPAHKVKAAVSSSNNTLSTAASPRKPVYLNDNKIKVFASDPLNSLSGSAAKRGERNKNFFLRHKQQSEQIHDNKLSSYPARDDLKKHEKNKPLPHNVKRSVSSRNSNKAVLNGRVGGGSKNYADAGRNDSLLPAPAIGVGSINKTERGPTNTPVLGNTHISNNLKAGNSEAPSQSNSVRPAMTRKQRRARFFFAKQRRQNEFTRKNVLLRASPRVNKPNGAGGRDSLNKAAGEVKNKLSRFSARKKYALPFSVINKTPNKFQSNTLFNHLGSRFSAEKRCASDIYNLDAHIKELLKVEHSTKSAAVSPDDLIINDEGELGKKKKSYLDKYVAAADAGYAKKNNLGLLKNLVKLKIRKKTFAIRRLFYINLKRRLSSGKKNQFNKRSGFLSYLRKSIFLESYKTALLTNAFLFSDKCFVGAGSQVLKTGVNVYQEYLNGPTFVDIFFLVGFSPKVLFNKYDWRASRLKLAPNSITSRFAANSNIVFPDDAKKAALYNPIRIFSGVLAVLYPRRFKLVKKLTTAILLRNKNLGHRLLLFLKKKKTDFIGLVWLNFLLRRGAPNNKLYKNWFKRIEIILNSIATLKFLYNSLLRRSKVSYGFLFWLFYRSERLKARRSTYKHLLARKEQVFEFFFVRRYIRFLKEFLKIGRRNFEKTYKKKKFFLIVERSGLPHWMVNFHKERPRKVIYKKWDYEKKALVPTSYYNYINPFTRGPKSLFRFKMPSSAVFVKLLIKCFGRYFLQHISGVKAGVAGNLISLSNSGRRLSAFARTLISAFLQFTKKIKKLFPRHLAEVARPFDDGSRFRNLINSGFRFTRVIVSAKNYEKYYLRKSFLFNSSTAVAFTKSMRRRYCDETFYKKNYNLLGLHYTRFTRYYVSNPTILAKFIRKISGLFIKNVRSSSFNLLRDVNIRFIKELITRAIEEGFRRVKFLKKFRAIRLTLGSKFDNESLKKFYNYLSGRESVPFYSRRPLWLKKRSKMAVHKVKSANLVSAALYKYWKYIYINKYISALKNNLLWGYGYIRNLFNLRVASTFSRAREVVGSGRRFKLKPNMFTRLTKKKRIFYSRKYGRITKLRFVVFNPFKDGVVKAAGAITPYLSVIEAYTNNSFKGEFKSKFILKAAMGAFYNLRPRKLYLRWKKIKNYKNKWKGWLEVFEGRLYRMIKWMGFADSFAQARYIICNGGIFINGLLVVDPMRVIKQGDIVTLRWDLYYSRITKMLDYVVKRLVSRLFGDQPVLRRIYLKKVVKMFKEASGTLNYKKIEDMVHRPLLTQLEEKYGKFIKEIVDKAGITKFTADSDIEKLVLSKTDLKKIRRYRVFPKVFINYKLLYRVSSDIAKERKCMTFFNTRFVNNFAFKHVDSSVIFSANTVYFYRVPASPQEFFTLSRAGYNKSWHNPAFFRDFYENTFKFM